MNISPSPTSATSSCDCGGKSRCRRQVVDRCVSTNNSIIPNNIESPKSPKTETDTDHDRNDSTQSQCLTVCVSDDEDKEIKKSEFETQGML